MLRIKYSSPQLQSHSMHTFVERRIIYKMKGEKQSKLSRTYKETPGPRERQNDFPVAGVLIYLFFAVSKQFSWAVRFEAILSRARLKKQRVRVINRSTSYQWDPPIVRLAFPARTRLVPVFIWMIYFRFSLSFITRCMGVRECISFRFAVFPCSLLVFPYREHASTRWVGMEAKFA